MIDALKTIEITKLSKLPVYKLIEELERLGIVKEMTGGKRGKQYLFLDYLNLFNYLNLKFQTLLLVCLFWFQ